MKYFIILLFILFACAQQYKYSPKHGRAVSLEEYNDYTRAYCKRQGWSNEITEAIISHKVIFGMIPDQVLMSVGKPNEIKRGMTQKGKTEEWMYGKKREISAFDVIFYDSQWDYLIHGIMSSINPPQYLLFINDTLIEWHE